MAHAASSVSAMIGRVDTLKPISLPPAAARTRCHEGGGVGERFAPQHERVDHGGQRLDGVVGAATAVDRDLVARPRRDVGVGAIDAVELAGVVERLAGRPRPAQHSDVLGRSAVAHAVVGEVPVPGLVGVAAAADDVDGGTALAELIERGQLAGGQGRGDEARSMGEQEAEALGGRGDVGGDEEPVRGVGEVADEHPVEAGVLVDPRRLGEHVGVEDRAPRRHHLGRLLGRRPADELRERRSHCRPS